MNTIAHRIAPRQYQWGQRDEPGTIVGSYDPRSGIYRAEEPATANDLLDAIHCAPWEPNKADFLSVTMEVKGPDGSYRERHCQLAKIPKRAGALGIIAKWLGGGLMGIASVHLLGQIATMVTQLVVFGAAAVAWLPFLVSIGLGLIAFLIGLGIMVAYDRWVKSQA